MLAGPSVNLVQDTTKLATKPVTKSYRGASKPTSKVVGILRDLDSMMEVDPPSVLSGTKRAYANLSIDLSTQVNSLTEISGYH